MAGSEQADERVVGATPESGGSDRVVAELAECQHGVVARRQLLHAGVTAREVHRRLEAGRLHLVHTGVYAVGHRCLTDHGRWLAGVLAAGEAAVLSHRTAAALWRIVEAPDARVHVTVPHADGGGRSRTGIAIHRTRALEPADRTEHFRIPVTGPSRTLCDLAGAVGPRALREAFGAAERLGLLDPAALARACEDRRGCRGIGRLRSLLAAHRPLPETRSELERRFLRICDAAELPRPAVNVVVEGLEVDCLWPTARLVVELDGFAYHRGRERFEQDRRRDARLQLAGLTVLRLTRRRLESEPEAVVTELRTALGRRLVPAVPSLGQIDYRCGSGSDPPARGRA